jgi:hypothetical protein
MHRTAAASRGSRRCERGIDRDGDGFFDELLPVEAKRDRQRSTAGARLGRDREREQTSRNAR